MTYNNNATAEATVRFHVTGAAQAASTDAPELVSKSYNSVTLKTVSANANGAEAQYSKDNGQTWQDSPVFTGLSPSTKYTFVVRYEATGNYEASPASPALEVTTEAAPVTMYSVTVSGGSGGTVSGGGTFAENTQITVTATPNNGYRFVRWEENGAAVSTSADYTFTVTSSRILNAVFERQNSGGGGGYTPPTTPTYPPTVPKPNEGGGAPAISPSRPERGDTVTVTPKPDEGYEVDEITVTDRNGRPVEVTKSTQGSLWTARTVSALKVRSSSANTSCGEGITRTTRTRAFPARTRTAPVSRSSWPTSSGA